MCLDLSFVTGQNLMCTFTQSVQHALSLLQLSAVWRNCQPVVKKEAQFKLTDRTAHLFAKGTCSAVL